ncbi:MAG: DnaB-like helicase C-terminal domain-containing protein [Flavobacterium sp.]
MKLPHSCGTRSGLQVFQKEDGSLDGFCFSCKQYVPDPLGDQPAGFKPPHFHKKTPEEVQEEIRDINLYTSRALEDRKIGLGTVDYFKVKVGLDEERGQDVLLHYYPYTKEGQTTAYKVRLVENKRIWSIGDMKDVDLFGWEQAIATGNKRLYITEGEIDAMSLFSVIMQKQAGTQYAENIPAVVSIPHGAASAGNDLSRLSQKIRAHFKEVVLVFDMDEAGRRAVEDVLRVFPEALSATLPKKDVNECVLDGNIKALYSAVVFNATVPKNTRLVYAEDLFEAAKEQAQFGLSWPWESTTEQTRGIRFGETVYIGAAPKMGKSEVVNALGAHLIEKHGLKVLMAKPEENNKKTVKLMAGKIAGRIFHDPKIEFDHEAYDKACEILRGKLTLLNLYQHLGWETLKGDIRAAAALGVKAVFIDPITNLTNGMNSADANVKLQEIAQELAAMALDLDIIIFIFCHLRNKDGGVGHDRGGHVLTSEFAGSRAMERSCNYMFGLEGNKDPDLPEEDRNLRQLVLLADREYGEVGPTKLYWNKNNGRFVEM